MGFRRLSSPSWPTLPFQSIRLKSWRQYVGVVFLHSLLTICIVYGGDDRGHFPHRYLTPEISPWANNGSKRPLSHPSRTLPPVSRYDSSHDESMLMLLSYTLY